MEFFNVVDDKERFVRLKVNVSQKTEQYDSHTVSYLKAREMYEERGDVMGFDNPDFKPYDLDLVKKRVA